MSSKINITNYEAFLLDYMEGNLPEADIALLKDFVLTHPELNIDLNDIELVELEAENVSFSSKENLKKTNSHLVSDELFVGYVENTLTEEEKSKIEELCAKDASLANELRLYKSTILLADKNIVFENKESLKKENKIIWFSTKIYLRAAAALLLLFGLWFTFRNIGGEKTNNETIIANNNSVKENSSNQNTNTVSITPNEEKQTAVESFTVAKNNLVNRKNNHSPKAPLTNNLPEPNIVNNAVDSIKPKEEPKLAITKIDTSSAPSLAVNNSNTVSKKIIVIEEADDEPVTSNNAPKEKKGFWYRAGKVLSGINKIGVKQVDGKDQSANNNEQYVLSLGNFSVEKNTFNKE